MEELNELAEKVQKPKEAYWYNELIRGSSSHKRERYRICGVLPGQNFQMLQGAGKVYTDGKQTKDP